MRLLTSAILSLALLSPALAVPGYPQGSQCGGGVDAHTADEVIAELGMTPVPGTDGSWVVKTFEDPLNVTSAIHTSRPAASARYHLLVRTSTNKGFGRWFKKADASEVWSYLGGAPVTITTARNDGTPAHSEVLGPNIFAGQRPQIVVPRGVWQLKKIEAKWSLNGGTSAPATNLGDVEIAPVGWWPKTS
ncbi:RmlC-like cupin domain-containing protein [Podospora conica]|nr:RmlC-like cupin domain-containing protein [Schizothecium conicum]